MKDLLKEIEDEMIQLGLNPNPSSRKEIYENCKKIVEAQLEICPEEYIEIKQEQLIRINNKIFRIMNDPLPVKFWKKKRTGIFNPYLESIKNKTTMDFSEALNLVKKGAKIARVGWNGKNQFAYYVPAANYPTKTDTIKDIFPDEVPYRAYMALKCVDDTVATWVPSVSDILADDWMVV